jgi:arsenate reductase-like glutaredoxin family protein
MLAYLSGAQSKLEYLAENQRLLKTPVVRDGRRATVGYCPEIWKNWQ